MPLRCLQRWNYTLDAAVPAVADLASQGLRRAHPRASALPEADLPGRVREGSVA